MKERLSREQKDFCREYGIDIPRCWFRRSYQEEIKKIIYVCQTYERLEEKREKLLQKLNELYNLNETLEEPRKCVALKWNLIDVMKLFDLNFFDLDSVVEQLEDLKKECRKRVKVLENELSIIFSEKQSQENREDLRRRLKHFLDSRPKGDSAYPVFIATEYKPSSELLRESYEKVKKDVKEKGIFSNGSRVIFDPTRVSIEDVAKEVFCSDKVKIIETF